MSEFSDLADEIMHPSNTSCRFCGQVFVTDAEGTATEKLAVHTKSHRKLCPTCRGSTYVGGEDCETCCGDGWVWESPKR